MVVIEIKLRHRGGDGKLLKSSISFKATGGGPLRKPPRFFIVLIEPKSGPSPNSVQKMNFINGA